MSFTVAIAVGAGAVDDLQTICRRLPDGTAQLFRDRELAVAWAAASPWVESHSDGDVLVVLDGRLHNHPPGEGSAAQWLLRRYRERGERVAAGLLGDFVLVVLDTLKRRLLVARDPIGVRPWYSGSDGQLAAGASDLGTLLDFAWVDATLNENMAIEYLAGRRQSRGETFYRGVRTLPPGSTDVHTPGQIKTLGHHSWTVAFERSISWDAAAERCRSMLDEAVRCRLERSGPPTSQLSGGLDSSAVVGTMVAMGDSRCLAGRMIFEGPRADERAYSDAVIAHWGIDSISAPPWLPTDAEAHQMIQDFRRPPPDPNFTMFGNLNTEMVRRGRTLALTGMGGDDAFLVMAQSHLLVSAIQLRRLSELAATAGTSLVHPRYGWHRILKPTVRYLGRAAKKSPRAWVTDEASTQAHLPELFHRRAAQLSGVAAVDERVDGLMSGSVAAALADVALFDDSLGIRHSHPFLDPRFVEATCGLDPWWPTRGDHVRALEIAAFSDRLPPLVLARRSKAEFSEVVWPHNLNAGVLESVRTGPLHEAGWLHADGFDELVRNATRGSSAAAMPLSRCVSLDRWLRTL